MGSKNGSLWDTTSIYQFFPIINLILHHKHQKYIDVGEQKSLFGV